ncbi:hypothetical protein [Enterobacter cloacae]|uniref:hypothetical protein n=1 Tax=Enterobacter cloacae TaxID=550 RepID=UPI00207604CB|nr:hypothetical protein [Enterobacter cloacae]MCM7405004.1 hypothetical protein [Enterobacter cloacae]
MSNINKQARDKLKSAAAKAVDNFDPNMFVETRDLLALLDELEAKETENERMARELLNRSGEIEGLRQRIAELEAREVRLTDINEYLAEVQDKTLNRAFRLLAEGVRAGDVAAMHAAGINIAAAGKGE